MALPPVALRKPYACFSSFRNIPMTSNSYSWRKANRLLWFVMTAVLVFRLRLSAMIAAARRYDTRRWLCFFLFSPVEIYGYLVEHSGNFDPPATNRLADRGDDPMDDIAGKNTGPMDSKYTHDDPYRLAGGNNAVSVADETSAYDAAGNSQRQWKDIGISNCFHQSDKGLISEYDGTGSEIKTYGYKPGSTWTTDPLFMKVGTEYYFYHNDHLGTPQKLTTISGAVVWSAKYSSFGKAEIDPASTVVNNLRLPGQYYDGETGLQYNYYRYYNPTTGKYTQTDPIGFAGEDFNLFNYVVGNPVNFIDPFGLKSRWGCIGACTADATLNFTFGFIPSFKFATEILFGADINVFQAKGGYDSIIDQDVTGLLSGFSSLGYGIAKSNYDVSGGTRELNRTAELIKRRSFENKPLYKQIKMKDKLSNLTKLRNISRMMGRINGIFNALDFAMDLYSCHEKCKKFDC
ncbi:MAG: RHS repeat domain-containing protein [Thermodesulfobacteriota bacterium]